jgi:hypothetical protein
MKCIVDQSDYSGEEDAPQTSYYQWVTFFFAIQVKGLSQEILYFLSQTSYYQWVTFFFAIQVKGLCQEILYFLSQTSYYQWVTFFFAIQVN